MLSALYLKVRSITPDVPVLVRRRCSGFWEIQNLRTENRKIVITGGENGAMRRFCHLNN